MNAAIKLATVTVSAAMLAASGFAQAPAKNKTKGDRSEEIIIRKKGGNTEKMTIVVDGDNMTINGKPVDEFKGDDLTVIKRKAPFLAMVPGGRPFNLRGGFDGDDGDFLMPASNKAMLGVLTAPGEDGVKIKDVTKESAAEKAGLQKDDLITKVGETKVTSPQELVQAISKYKPDDKVEITYKRDGKENKTTATLEESKSRNLNFNFDNKDFNFNMPDVPVPDVRNFNFQFNRRPKIGLQIQDLEEGKGVSIKDVDEESPAAKAGLKEGDVITQLNGKDVAGVDELRDQLQDVEDGDTVKFTYKRGGKSQTAEIRIPKRLKSADL